MKTSGKSRERGSVLVETALVLIVFLWMLLSIFDFGQVLFLHQAITERIREALRYGIVNSYSATSIQNYVLYGQPSAGVQADYSLTPAMVSVQRLDAGTSEDRVTITVSGYPYVFITPLIAGQRTGAAITETLPYEGP